MFVQILRVKAVNIFDRISQYILHKCLFTENVRDGLRKISDGGGWWGVEGVGVVWGVDFIVLPYYRTYSTYSERQAKANSVDLDQTPQNAASDQDLHCLPLTQQF